MKSDSCPSSSLFTTHQRSCGSVMFSVVSVCRAEGVPCDHYPWYIGPHFTAPPWPSDMGPHCTGTLSLPLDMGPYSTESEKLTCRNKSYLQSKLACRHSPICVYHSFSFASIFSRFVGHLWKGKQLNLFVSFTILPKTYKKKSSQFSKNYIVMSWLNIFNTTKSKGIIYFV